MRIKLVDGNNKIAEFKRDDRIDPKYAESICFNSDVTLKLKYSDDESGINMNDIYFIKNGTVCTKAVIADLITMRVKAPVGVDWIRKNEYIWITYKRLGYPGRLNIIGKVNGNEIEIVNKNSINNQDLTRHKNDNKVFDNYGFSDCDKFLHNERYTVIRYYDRESLVLIYDLHEGKYIYINDDLKLDISNYSDIKVSVDGGKTFGEIDKNTIYSEDATYEFIYNDPYEKILFSNGVVKAYSINEKNELVLYGEYNNN